MQNPQAAGVRRLRQSDERRAHEWFSDSAGHFASKGEEEERKPRTQSLLEQHDVAKKLVGGRVRSGNDYIQLELAQV
eukprot:CAMPEP_0171521678 /NCGR_PEP_ID=MMETSP0959-20130129/7268_1 /TAXON_ID=87120 /ORGANISM="Aurantiochytrium limacinum, Strain ATCCMYA-1381" /LENGTH=76 /DNA_ID=CAMNT_0012061611 /DNA_START=117 /DNA_END=348 /DNA_ORIENTATION=-